MTDSLQIKIYFNLDNIWVDVTSDVLSGSKINAVWGMRDNKPLSLLADVGQLTFSLNNETGKYSPDGVSTVSGWKKGVAVKVVFTFMERSYVRFYGKVDKIKIDAGNLGNRRAHVTVLDWLDYATKYPLNNPAIQQEKRADEAFNTIVDSMQIQPQARSFAEGDNTFDLVFHDATLKTRAYSEFSKLVLSEYGYAYLKKDPIYGETLVFESSSSRPNTTQIKEITEPITTGYLLKEDGGYLLTENGDKILIESYSTADVLVDNNMLSVDVSYGDNLINRVSTTVNPARTASTPSLLYNLDRPIFIDAFSRQKFNIQFTDSSSKRLVAALPPDGSTYPQSLLHFDEPSAASLILDEGAHSWYAEDVELVSNIVKFGSHSVYLDGTQSYIYSSFSDDYDFGGGDFTIEWWEYRFSASSGAASVCRSGAGGYVPWILGQSNGTSALIYMSSDGASWDIANGRTFGTISTNEWVHFAITRSGATFRAYKNGAQTDTWSSEGEFPSSTADLVIGKNSSSYINACIDEFRITKGLARYTAASFTPATEPFALSGVVMAGWTNESGTGTDITNSLSLTDVYGASGAEIEIENTGNIGGWLTTLKIYSYIVESVSPITSVLENIESVEEYGYSELSVNQPYQQDLANGVSKAGKLLELERLPSLVLNKATMNANRSNTMMLYFLETDIGDLVHVVEDQTGIDASFFIQGFEFSATAGANGAIVDFSWILKKFKNTVSGIGLYFYYNAYGLPSQYVEYGILPLVNNVHNKIISVWYKGPQDNNGYFASDFYNGRASFFGFFGSNRRLVFKNLFFSLQEGVWRTNTFTIPDTSSTWTNFVVAYDYSSVNNDPVFYINGSVVASSEQIAPIGSVMSRVNAKTIGGGAKSTDATTVQGVGIGASLADIRIYDADNISDIDAFVAAIYADGVGSATNEDGILFNAFNVNVNEVSKYENVNLSEDMKLIDSVSGVAGTPINSPTAITY